MAQKTLKTGKLFRTLELDRGAIDKEARTVTLSFSSENPVDRWFGTEILDHSPGSVRMDRLKDGGPFLLNHDGRDQIGVVESAQIAPDRMGRAVLRFGKSSRAEEIFQDVQDGIRRNVSVGYFVHRMDLESEDKEKGNTYRATDWEPVEVSIVAVPADVTVGIGRSMGEGDHETIIQKRSIEMPEPTVEKVDIKKIEADGQNAEHTRVKEILAIGDLHECHADATRFVRERKSIDEFKTFVLETKYKAKPLDLDPNIGMSEKEKRSYSLIRAIRQMAENGRLDGIEKEASVAVSKMCAREARGFFIPPDIMMEKRVMQVGDSAKGGFTVGTDVLGSSMIELLRNKTKVAQLGAMTLSGLVGNAAIPRVTGGATSYWLSETGAVTASDQAFGQLALVPKRLVGDTAYTKELLMQSSIDIEGFIREDIMRVLAIAKDLAAINGLGANGEPIGILNTTGINTITFGAAATWAKVVDFETQIAVDNADVETMALLTTPAVRGKWKTAVKVASQAVFLWEGTTVNGYRAEVSNQVPGDKVIFGNWRDLILADWAGIDVVVDPYSLKKQGQVEITVTLWTDIGVRHAVSFAVSTDSGAQ